MLGYIRKTRTDRNGEGVNRGEGWGGEGHSTSCQETEWQVKQGYWAAKLLHGPLSDKRRKAYLCIRSSDCKLSCLTCLCHLTGLQGPILLYSGTIQPPRVSANISHWSTFKTSEPLNTSTTILSVSPLLYHSLLISARNKCCKCNS